MRNLTILFACAGIFILLGASLIMGGKSIPDSIAELRGFLASIFFVDSVTVDGLHQAYARAKLGTGKVKILVVPGHDEDSWGTEFRSVKEAAVNAQTGEKLAAFLKRDPEFDVILARDQSGYHPELARYFERERDAILKFAQAQQATMEDLTDAGLLESVSGVGHGTAGFETRIRLYGINKWANENGVHIVLHIHFNDHAGRRSNHVGKYSGISVYVPERQYSNAKASRAFGEAIFKRLTKFTPASDLPKEDAGVVEDQDLIAVGTSNTVDGASILIEYGYIYEPQFLTASVRERVIEHLAYQTYLGVRDFFGIAPNSFPFATTLLPHQWKETLEKNMKAGTDTLALQAALAEENLYPPKGFGFRDCPLSGIFGECTERTVIEFQKRYGITPASGIVGPATRAKLNELYAG